MSDGEPAPDEEWDPNLEERRNVTRLLRWIGAFVAWPALTIGLILTLDLSEHLLHVAGLLPIGLLGVALFWKAPRLAERFYPVA